MGVVTRIIGIDPGSRTTGVGIIQQNGNHLRHLFSGVIQPSKDATLSSKLKSIFLELTKIIEEYQPHTASIERIFHSVNARSSLILGHARGAAVLCLELQNLGIYEYSPTEIKSAIVGAGRASKSQVNTMVGILLNRKVVMQEDESDALATAICHAHCDRFIQHTRRLVGN